MNPNWTLWGVITLLIIGVGFSCYNWGKSERIVQVVERQVPVKIEIPAVKGEIKYVPKPYPVLVSVHDTVWVPFFNLDSTYIQPKLKPVEDTVWFKRIFKDSTIVIDVRVNNYNGWSLDYEINGQTIDTSLAVTGTNQYIEASQPWYQHWYYLPIGAALYYIGESAWKK